MKNYKISKKLFITFGIVVILFITTLACALYGMRILSSNFAKLHNGPYITSTAAMDLRRSIIEVE